MEKQKINWKQKLTSRKLWAALVGIVAGLASVFGITENDYAQVAGLVTMAASVVAYIFGEAKVDSARQFYQVDNSPRLKPGDSRLNDHCLQEQV